MNYSKHYKHEFAQYVDIRNNNFPFCGPESKDIFLDYMHLMYFQNNKFYKGYPGNYIKYVLS